MKLLNLGCGAIYDDEWVNIDMTPTGKGVLHHDILKGIPFPDNTFDVVYHSHLLEHLHADRVLPFLRECFRAMKPGGVHRVVVPDLEAIISAYQTALHAALAGKEGVEQQYDWIMLELYDQALRSSTGGVMAHCMRSADTNLRNFIRQRIGLQAVDFWNEHDTSREKKYAGLLQCGASFYFKKIREILAKAAVTLFLGAEGRDSLETGIFRKSGEIHKWMYDRFSLKRLLSNAGFTEIRVCAAAESRIPGFDGYNLEVVNGNIRKPDSLFMEGIKP